jgi:heme/copper-type cytochrome/quinol oxidase subunit 2
MSEEEDSSLPGIKRGIAIGVAFSVSIVLIAILTYFVIRRRRKTRKQKAKTTSEEDLEKEVVLPEKATWIVPPPPPPLVEADARAVYELDATEIAELPSDMNPDAQTQRLSSGNLMSEEERDLYAQKMRQQERWSFTYESDVISPSSENARGRSSPPMVSPSHDGFIQVSPSPNPSRNVTSRSASPGKALPQLPEMHFGSGRWSPQQLP